MATNSNKYLMGSSTINTPNVSSTSFNGLQFNGQGVLDNICVRNYVQTDAEATNESISETPDWTKDVIFLTVFNHTTDSANVFSLNSPQTSWVVSRQEVGSDVVKTIATLEPNVNSFIDYKVKGNATFNYLIQAQNDAQLSSPIISDSLETSFFGVYLIDAVSIDSGVNNSDVECYKLDFNTSVGSVSNNSNITTFKNYTKYDSYFIGNTDYLSSTVTSLLAYWDGNNQITWNAEYLDKFRSFINNKQEKILKFKNGKVIRCTTFTSDTESFNYTFENGISESGSFEPTTVTFGFRETGIVE